MAFPSSWLQGYLYLDHAFVSVIATNSSNKKEFADTWESFGKGEARRKILCSFGEFARPKDLLCHVPR